ncbi:MAG TPA: hypothetical protein VLU46_13920 [Thermoanaerobaculia bacterium]|nr:hypothetical protein [Thermoanaerobaculia bacterium]
MRLSPIAFAAVAILSASALYAQTPEPSSTTTAAPPLLADAAAPDRQSGLPSLNVYLPEGEASVRLRKLIKNVLFESQIIYRFVSGDISTFLRYKYYARNFTYRIGVFDQIGFPDVGSSGGLSGDFQRVRGGLLLLGFPRDYNRRYFWLLQDDRLTFGDTDNVDNRRNNVYTKLGWQYGTQFDERLNAIVGESRGRISPVLTAFLDIGPQKTGVAAAITESAHLSTGAYKYTKLEAEGLRRTDVTANTFIFSRLHAGAFVGYDTIAGRADRPEQERYSIPLYEMLQLGGRDALKSIRDVRSEGTHEIHLTNEYFVPVFRNKDLRTGVIHWNTMYGIGYLGAGTVGFHPSEAFKAHNAVVDGGLGTEMGLTVRDFDVLLSVVYAHTLHAPDELRGGKWRFFIRTVR